MGIHLQQDCKLCLALYRLFTNGFFGYSCMWMLIQSLCWVTSVVQGFEGAAWHTLACQYELISQTENLLYKVQTHTVKTKAFDGFIIIQYLYAFFAKVIWNKNCTHLKLNCVTHALNLAIWCFCCLLSLCFLFQWPGSVLNSYEQTESCKNNSKHISTEWSRFCSIIPNKLLFDLMILTHN